jgi:prevent-host-death family protein
VRHFPEPRARPIKEIPVTDLRRRAADAVRWVEGGGRAIVTRHGNPAAVIISVEEGMELVVAEAHDYVRRRLEADER